MESITSRHPLMKFNLDSFLGTRSFGIKYLELETLLDQSWHLLIGARAFDPKWFNYWKTCWRHKEEVEYFFNMIDPMVAYWRKGTIQPPGNIRVQIMHLETIRTWKYFPFNATIKHGIRIKYTKRPVSEASLLPNP